VPDTLQGLAVALLALLPGALYTWAFEQVAGRWGISLADRVWRFVGASAILQALAAPLTYLVWRHYLADGRLARGELAHLPWLFWAALLVYVLVPVVAGRLVGHAARNRQSWARYVVGTEPVPRAWDLIFSQGENFWVRIKLKSGPWVGGAFADGSYAAPYPEPADLFISQAALIDAETGEFLTDDDENTLLTGGGLLIRWEEVEYLEVLP
jgi:hypothetical protein